MAARRQPELLAELEQACAELGDAELTDAHGCDAVAVPGGRAYALIAADGRIGVRLPDWDLFAAAYELPGSDPLFEGDQRVGHWVVLPDDLRSDPAALRVWLAPRARALGEPRVSERRARSFGSVAEDYEATRAGWPVEPFAIALEHFGVPGRPDVVDIAAGTGKLTRTLAQIAGTLVAIEPDADLRAVLTRELPAVTVLDGTAEALPLPDASADVACAGQAFHWFDVERALAEIGRVLRPRGVVIAGWNLPPEDGTWYDAVVAYLRVANPDHLPSRTQDWAAVLAAEPGYAGLLEISARHEQPIERAAFRRLLGTHSAINVLPAPRREELLDAAVGVADSHGAFDDEGQGAIAWRCDLFAMQREPR